MQHQAIVLNNVESHILYSIWEDWDQSNNLALTWLMHRCVFDQNQPRVKCEAHCQSPTASVGTHAQLQKMLNPHLFLGDWDCIKSPDTIYEEINPTLKEQPSLFSHRKLNKGQRNRLTDKEGEKCGIYSKGFFHISGEYFQWDDKLSAGICSKWISHNTPRNRGFRVLVAKRAISATGMSAVSSLPFELQNIVDKCCTRQLTSFAPLGSQKNWKM